MPKCPSCDAVLEQDFGMVTCPSCQAVLMVDISGQVQMASEEPATFEDDEELDDYSVEDTQGGLQDSTDDSDPEEESSFQTKDFDENTAGENFDSEDSWKNPSQNMEGENDELSVEAETQFDNFDDEDPVGESQGNNPAFDHFNSEEPEEETFDGEDPQGLGEENDLNSPPGKEELLSAEGGEETPTSSVEEPIDEYEDPQEEFPIAAKADPNPVDITEFANSEASNLEEGELLYDIFISRIDSKDLRQEVKFVLMDEKLKLNHGEYMKKIKGGRLIVPDLNPIKAKRVVEQLQYSDLDIKWRQKRVIIETVEPEEDFDEGGGIEGEEADL